MDKINVKSQICYFVEINKDIEVENPSDREEIKDTLTYEAWKMIKNGDFSSVKVEFNRVI